MTRNTHFLEQVSRIFGKDDEIIVGCQSGKRSLTAATERCSAVSPMISILSPTTVSPMISILSPTTASWISIGFAYFRVSLL
ncbi:unnamed protein product [Urochloa humidicola]